MNIEEQLKMTNNAYSRADALDHDLWQRWLAAGYRLHVAESYRITNSTNILLQKAIYKDGVKLFFINVWVYIWDTTKDRRLALQPECQYNTHMDQEPTFNVTYMGNVDDPSVVEKFFTDIYDRINCQPYGD